MTTEINDVVDIVRNWMLTEKKAAHGLIVSELLNENGDKLFAIDDANGRSLALIQPFRFSTTEVILDERVPEHRRIRQQIDSWDDSIPLEQFLSEEAVN